MHLVNVACKTIMLDHRVNYDVTIPCCCQPFGNISLSDIHSLLRELPSALENGADDGFIRLQESDYFYRNLTSHMNKNPSAGDADDRTATLLR